MMKVGSFWAKLEEIVLVHPVAIDRPKGSAHPRHPGAIYPFDYGYLSGTRSPDGGGVDVWVGSLPDRRITGAIVAVDADKGDVELKVLLGCTGADARAILEFHNSGSQAALLVERPEGE